MPTLRISGAVTPLPHTSSWPASIPHLIMCCGIHPEDGDNRVFRNIGKNSSNNAASHPQKNDGIFDYTSLKTSQLDYVFGITMSSLEFVCLKIFFYWGNKHGWSDFPRPNDIKSSSILTSVIRNSNFHRYSPRISSYTQDCVKIQRVCRQQAALVLC